MKEYRKHKGVREDYSESCCKKKIPTFLTFLVVQLSAGLQINQKVQENGEQIPRYRS